MAVQSVQPLVQAALCGSRIRFRSWATALHWRGLRLRIRCTTGSSRRRRRALSLPVGDVFLVAGGARPWRNAGGLAASPVRPMIGNSTGKLGTCPEAKADAQRRKRPKVRFKYHATCWAGSSARGWADFVAGLWSPGWYRPIPADAGISTSKLSMVPV
jgi:hypothetical protein